MVRSLIAVPFAVMALAGGANAAAQIHECRRGADVRSIEVVVPGAVGAACDLKYVRDNGANVSVPYHAENSPTFCDERARIMIRSLEGSGYDCVEGAPTSEPPDLRAGIEPAEAGEETIAALANAAATLEQPAAGEAAGVRPETEAARRGPVALSPTAAALPARAAPAAPATGRITGAEPGRAAPAPAVVANAEKPAPAKPRSSEDVIRSVLAAQTAAWNDADLDAFMATFWRSGDLRLIAGTKVAKGWAQASQHYRDRLGETADFGRLTRNGFEIEMVSDDVAVVFGHYSLNRANRLESGATTLVMKRIDGLWRIVHAHSDADASPTE